MRWRGLAFKGFLCKRVLLLFHVGVEMVCTLERCLWDEEDDQRKHHSHENGYEVEGPWPSDLVGHLANNDWCQEGASEEGDICKCHPHPSFVNKV